MEESQFVLIDTGTVYDLRRLEEVLARWVRLAFEDHRVIGEIRESIVRVVLVIEEDGFGRGGRDGELAAAIGGRGDLDVRRAKLRARDRLRTRVANCSEARWSRIRSLAARTT